MRAGRPRLDAYADRFTVPAATPGSAVSVTFLGVASLLLDDGTSAVMTDGYFSRPSLARVAARRLAPDAGRIDAGLRRAGVRRLEAVVPVHGHVDHALDSAPVAARTGALLVGDASIGAIGRGHGLSADRIREVAPGETVPLGAWRLTFVTSRHCPPDRYPGPVDGGFRSPARASAYRCGTAWSMLAEHVPSARRLLVQGSAGHVPGALRGGRADVAYLGVGQLGLRPEAEIAAYWAETVRAVGARRAVLIHWDDFFRPLEPPLRGLPYAGDDLDVSVRVLTRLARADGVDLAFPRPWTREDPWA